MPQRQQVPDARQDDAEPYVVNPTPQSELWLAEFTDPDGNQLALMSEVAKA